MKFTQKDAVQQDWDQTKSWNYKLPHMSEYKSVVYAEVTNSHGQVQTNEVERVYFVISGEGEFEIDGKLTPVAKHDVITVPPNTTYNYRSVNHTTFKIVLFMELWDN